MDKVQGAPVPVHDLRVWLKPATEVRAARLLKTDRPLNFTREAEGQIICAIPELETFEVVVFDERP